MELGTEARTAEERTTLSWRSARELPGATNPGFPGGAYARAAHDGAADARRPSHAWMPPRPRAAGPSERAVALLVDAVTVVLLLGAVAVLASLVLSRGLHWLYRDAGDGSLVSAHPLAIPSLVALPVAAALAYCAVLPGLRGATLGMRLVGLRLSADRPGGGPAGVRRAALRFALWAVGTVALAGPLSVLLAADHRGWHDRVSGTVLARRGEAAAARGEARRAA